jgi:hypothetical protein
MTPHAVAALIDAWLAKHGGIRADALDELTDYQWRLIAERAGVPTPNDGELVVGPETRRIVAGLVKARASLPADPFHGLPAA